MKNTSQFRASLTGFLLCLCLLGAIGWKTIATQMAIWDGTNQANVVAGDTGYNGLTIARGRLSVAFSTTSAQAVASTDVSGYASVSVFISTQGASSNVTFQGSDDNSTWINLALINPVTIGSTASTSTGSAGAILVGNLGYRYFRLNVTGIASGTTAGTVYFFTQPWYPTSGAQVAYLGAGVTGTLTYSNTALTNTAVAIKTSAAGWYGGEFYNPNATVEYIQIYNVAQGSVTVGTTAPTRTFAIPSLVTLVIHKPVPTAFGTAFTMAATTTATGGTAPATALSVAVDYD